MTTPVEHYYISRVNDIVQMVDHQHERFAKNGKLRERFRFCCSIWACRTTYSKI